MRTPFTYRGFSPPRESFWLFAYASLMWKPEFRFAERRRAQLMGYHRALSVYSWVYRGTEEKPGLVFALERGGMTEGMVYRIHSRDARDVFEYVYEREMVTAVYQPVWADCRLTRGPRRTVSGLAFVANPLNEQYAGELSEAETLKLVNQGRGIGGPCTEYVTNTAEHLRDLGIRDRALERLIGKLND